MKRYYMVCQNGIEDYDGQTLARCLRYIGRRVNNGMFGAGLITVGQAISHGYTITSYLA